jgi:hypothetical protein
MERVPETQCGCNSRVNDLLSVWRLEPGGAEGQLESMAAGNTMMVPPRAEEAQVQSHVVLHNGNGKRSGNQRSALSPQLSTVSPEPCLRSQYSAVQRNFLSHMRKAQGAFWAEC